MEPYRQSVAPEHGPRIAAIGGGTGLSTLLRGLKRYTKNITAIVTVADDGGGSGRLRQDLGMLPPGDIRNCLEALANAEPLMAQLMHYRFPEGELAGQSFGNLFLAALNGIMPSFDRAVESLSQVLAITGRVLPVTNENIQLEAEFENGVRVVGESRIFQCKQEQDCRIRRVNLLPSRPKALPEAVEAIREAEMVVLAPGSLYTSIIPNLLVDGIVEAIRESRALKIYVCNVMTQEGDRYTLGISARLLAQLLGRLMQPRGRQTADDAHRRSGDGISRRIVGDGQQIEAHQPQQTAQQAAEDGDPLVVHPAGPHGHAHEIGDDGDGRHAGNTQIFHKSPPYDTMSQVLIS